MTKVLPFDAFAIRRYGIDLWLSEYQLPVHWRDFRDFVDSLFQGLDTMFGKLSRAERETLIATSDFVMSLRDVLYLQAFEQWAHSRGYTIDIDPAIAASLAPANPNLQNPFSLMLAGPASLHLRSVARSYVENRPLGVGPAITASLDTLAARGSQWSVGTMGGLKRRWMESCRETARTVYCDSLLARALPVARPFLAPAIGAAIDSFGRGLTRTLERTLGRELPDAKFPVAQLMDTWKQRAALSSALIETLRKQVRRRPDTLLLNEVWKPNHRLLCLALRGVGTRVVAFAHGNDPMHLIQPQHAYMALGHINTYVCETPASAAAHRSYFASTAVSSAFPIDFVSADETSYAEQFSKAPPPKAHAGRTRVMVIGYPMLPHRTQFDVSNGLGMHLEGELRILALLRDRGFYTIYKAHPETRMQAEALFKGKADSIDFQPFERVVDSADVIVFLTTVTSTFGAAVCTRKPIVVLNHQAKAWNPVVGDLYARRCRLVRSWIDDTNRIRVDEDEFWKALEFPGPTPDFKIVEKIFSPVPWKAPEVSDTPATTPATASMASAP